MPLAFVCSFFGMNAKEINDSNWPLSRFWESAIPITFATIVAPLAFTPFIRLLYGSGLLLWRESQQGWVEYTDYSLRYFIVIVTMIHGGRYLGRLHRIQKTDNDWKQFKRFIALFFSRFGDFFSKTSNAEPLAVNIVLATISALKAIHKLQQGRRGDKLFLLFWVTLTIVSALCAGLSRLDRTVATLVIPWAFLSLPLVIRLANKTLHKLKEIRYEIISSINTRRDTT